MFDQIVEREVAALALALVSNLQKTKDTVEELHVKYTLLRMHKEESEEDKLEEEDDSYAGAIEQVHQNAIRVYYAYSNQLKGQEHKN